MCLDGEGTPLGLKAVSSWRKKLVAVVAIMYPFVFRMDEQNEVSVKWNNYVKLHWFSRPFHEEKKRNPWMFSLLYQFSSWDCLITLPNFNESACGT